MSFLHRIIRLLNPKVRRKLKAVRRGRAYANGFIPSENGKYPTVEQIREYRERWAKTSDEWYSNYCRRARLKKLENRRQQTLIIVDPQTSFIKTDDDSPGRLEGLKLIKEINLQIRMAKRLGWPVIVLTYAGYGDIHPKVLEVLKRAESDNWKCHYGVKNIRNGGSQVLQLCSENGLSTQRFRVVGGHTNQCLKATVGELIQLSPESQFEIVTRACWPNEFGYWPPFINSKNILLLPAPIRMPTPLPSLQWWNLRALKSHIT